MDLNLSTHKDFFCRLIGSKMIFFFDKISRNLNFLNFFWFFVFSFLFKNQFGKFVNYYYLKSTCISTRVENENIDIKNCLIMLLSSDDHGGAILINSPGFNVIIDDTTFLYCYSKWGGGAIFIVQCFLIKLSKICAMNCKSDSWQFGLCGCTGNQSFELISINKCSNNSDGIWTMVINDGNQIVTNINISSNFNIIASGIVYSKSLSMISKFCSFYNNSAFSRVCIAVIGEDNGETSFDQIEYSNIILNNSPTYGVFSIGSNSYCILYKCIFNNNENILFYIEQGSITLNNCFINHFPSNITTNGTLLPLFIPNKILTLTKHYIHDIYSTYYCSYTSELDSIMKSSDISMKIILLSLSFVIIIISLVLFYFFFNKEKSESEDLSTV